MASSPEGFEISARRITISTVGLPAAIDRLASTAPQYRLAISLHAPHDELRNQLVPVNARIGLKQILAAADRYFSASGRRLTFEYVLLAGVNDRREHARQLVELLGGRRVLLNIIPYNRVSGLPYRTPTAAALQQFRAVLESAGVAVKVRHRKGSRINAACGQLRFPNQGRGEESSVGSVDDK
jgi:23S rRNA (adenine2503-C2)-methyltransferase